ncbi:MAG: HEAT repeat domain-containing protein [Gemmataceae bacterium]
MAKILLTATAFLALMATFARAEETREQRAEKYIKQLDSSEARLRAKAAEEIAKLAEIKSSLGKPALKRLLQLLEDKDSDVRAASVKAVCELDEPKDVVGPVIKMLKEEKQMSVQLAAIRGLGIIGEPAKEAAPLIRDIAQTARKENNNRLAQECRNALETISGRIRQKQN